MKIFLLSLALLLYSGCTKTSDKVTTPPSPTARPNPTSKAQDDVDPKQTPGEIQQQSEWLLAPRFCPEGTKLSPTHRLCMDSKGNAIGPFPEAMIVRCKEVEIALRCEKPTWSKTTAENVRGTSLCHPGTSISDKGACVEKNFAYGPFAVDIVNACKKLNETQCESMKWDIALYERSLQKHQEVKNEPPLIKDTPTSRETPTSNPNTTGINYCDYSWEEKPGYADYTTINWFARSGGYAKLPKFDRVESKTLQGSGTLNGSMCANAKVLKKCFDKSAKHDEAGNAPQMIEWAKRKGLNYQVVRMAFSMQETHLGAAHDQCAYGTCNGIGPMQVITAIAPNGQNITTSTTDPRWDGITYNVLTNMSYSSRVMKSKLNALGANASLRDLAAAYNGNPPIKWEYADNVVKYYYQILACKIY